MTESILQKFFDHSANYIECPPRFALKFLAKAYQLSEFKSTLTGVFTKKSHQRFLSLMGLPHNNFHFRVVETDGENKVIKRQLILNVDNTDHEVEAITNKDGVVILLDGSRLTSYVPVPHIDFLTATDKPIKTRNDDQVLLRAIMHGDPESLAIYMQKNWSKYTKFIQRKNITSQGAEDILQAIHEKYIKLVQSGQWDFDGDTNKVQAMIHTMINNEVNDFFRKEMVRSNISVSSIHQMGDDGEITDIADLTAHQGSDGLRDPLVALEGKDILPYIKLLETEAQLTVLKYLQVLLDWSEHFLNGGDNVLQKEFCEIYDLTHGTMSQHLSRARTYLKENGLGKEALTMGVRQISLV